MDSPIQRILRTQRLMRRAADILDREAKVLADSYQVQGQWRPESEADHAAQADHDEMVHLAAQLRQAAG